MTLEGVQSWISGSESKKCWKVLDLDDPEVNILDNRGTKVLASVVSPSFDTMDEAERQSMVWGRLIDELGDHDSRWVEFVFTDSPRCRGHRRGEGRRPRILNLQTRRPARSPNHVPARPTRLLAGRPGPRPDDRHPLHPGAVLLLPVGPGGPAENIRTAHGFDFQEVDASDPSLIEQIGPTVPVIAVDGKVRFRGEVNRVLFERLIAAAGDA